MKKDSIIRDVNDYLAGKITRSELSIRARHHRTATPFSLENYGSFANLLLDGIEQKLSAIPDESYSDDELKRIVDVLEGRCAGRHDFAYVIPSQMIDNDLWKLIQITERFLDNFSNGKTYPIKIKICLTNGEIKYNDIEAFFAQEDYGFCQTLYNVLGNNTRDTIVKSVARNLLSIINRYIGGWDGITTYFASSETISDDILADDLKRSLLALCGKRPVYVSLYGRIEHLCATIVL